MKRKVIGIVGSGTDSWQEYTEPLAVWIARAQYHLLTGAGNGVMSCASAAFVNVTNRRGLCLGIVPTIEDSQKGYVPLENYPNPWVELAIYSPLGTFKNSFKVGKSSISRNHTCVLSSDVLVALPGQLGTKNEIALAKEYNKPLILFAPSSEMSDFPASLPRTDSLSNVIEFVETQLARTNKDK